MHVGMCVCMYLGVDVKLFRREHVLNSDMHETQEVLTAPKLCEGPHGFSCGTDYRLFSDP